VRHSAAPPGGDGGCGHRYWGRHPAGRSLDRRKPAGGWRGHDLRRRGAETQLPRNCDRTRTDGAIRAQAVSALEHDRPVASAGAEATFGIR
jgi:hypothetical protein